jgi:PilZ domain
MEQDRRRTPRVPFVADAELLEVQTGMRMNTQVSELSLHGCYVDTLNPLPESTEVYVKVFTQEYSFEAPAVVAYSHPHLGMGLAFHDVKPHFLGVLQNWIMAGTPGKEG